MSDEAVEQTSTDTDVVPEPATEQVVIHNAGGDQQVEAPAETETAIEDTTDWKAEARKWEARAKANKAAVTPAQATTTETAEAPTEPAETEPEPETAKPDPLVIENLVLRAAPKLGADADDLLDSRRLMADLEALDQTADDYADKVQAAIKAAVDARPSLAGKPARAGKSGNPVGGGATHVELDPKKLATPSPSGPRVRLYQ